MESQDDDYTSEEEYEREKEADEAEMARDSMVLMGETKSKSRKKADGKSAIHIEEQNSDD